MGSVPRSADSERRAMKTSLTDREILERLLAETDEALDALRSDLLRT